MKNITSIQRLLRFNRSTRLLSFLFLTIISLLPINNFLYSTTITSTVNGGNWSLGTTWVGGTAPTSSKDVVIVGTATVNIDANAACNNLTINSGGKLTETTPFGFQLRVYGTSLVCDGTLGDSNASNSQIELVTYAASAQTLTISGAGSIYFWKITPHLSGTTTIFAADTRVTYATTSITTEASGINGNTYTINSGKTLTLAGNLSPGGSASAVGVGNTTVNVNGTLTVGGTLNPITASGKTFAVYVGAGGALNTTGTLEIAPSYSVQAPTITVASTGSITASGNVDCSNLTYLGAITGTGTFTLATGGTILLAVTTGLEPINGPIQTSIRNFSSGTISYVGTSAQVTGSDAISINNLTINNTAGVTLSGSTTVNGTLTFSSGLLNTSTYTLTIGSAGSISGASSSKYLNGNLAMIYSATGSKTFPIGGGGLYRPLTINATALDVTPSTFTVYQTESALSGTMPANTTLYTPRKWTVAQTGSTTYAYDLTLTGGSGFTPTGTVKILQNNAGTVSSYSTTGTYTASGLSSVGSFGLGDYTITPTVTTQAVTSISTTTATGNGNITSLGVPNPTQYGQCWKTTAGASISDTKTTNGSALATGAFTSSLTGLTANTSYYVNAYATNAAGTVYGTEVSFTTLPNAPTVAAANPITSSGFTANWTAPTQGGATFTYTVEYGTVSDLSSGTTDVPNIASTNLSNAIGSLASSTTYYYMVKAVNTSGSGAWSSIQSVTTLPPAPAITSFTPTSAGNGSSVVITGTNFTGATAVSFGGTAASSYHVVNDTQVTAVVGTGADGSVSITTPSGTGTKTGFTWLTIITDSQTALNLSLNSLNNVSIESGGLLTINQNTSVNSIMVKPGGKLTLNNSFTLSTPSLTLQNTASASASFVDSNSADIPTVVSATVNQDISATDRNWYVSVPVSGKTSTALTFGTSIVSRDEPNAAWTTLLSTDNLVPGVGYISRASTAGTTTWSVSGNLNSGLVQPTVTASSTTSYIGYNLLGNPYPSYLNWSAVLQNSTNASILQSTIWYRTKSAGTYSFQTYNASGDLGTPINASGYIPPMQAFWVLANSGGGTVTLNNAMRSHGDGSANMLKVKSVNKSLQPTLRIVVQNLENNNSDEAVVYFNPNASNGYDAYDSQKMSNANAAIPEIYTSVNGQNLVINGLNSIPLNTELPLGFCTGQQNTFSIKASQLSNFDPGTQLILKDNVLGTQTDLTDGSAYSFSSDVTNSSTRFSVLFKSASLTTGIDPSLDNSVSVYRNEQNQIAVNYFGNVSHAELSVYNVAGQKLVSKQLSGTTTIINTLLGSGVFVVRVTKAGVNTTKEVILN